jgi:transcriptional regulator with XRE-family HTH domain
MATRKSRRPPAGTEDSSADNPAVVFGRLLRRYRNRSSKILKEAAEALGFKSVTYVSDVECGLRNPFPTDQLLTLCKFYRCSEEETLEVLVAAALATGKIVVNPEPHVAELAMLFAARVNRLSDADIKRVDGILRKTTPRGEK